MPRPSAAARADRIQSQAIASNRSRAASDAAAAEDMQDSFIGADPLSTLNTANQTSLVAAINEVKLLADAGGGGGGYSSQLGHMGWGV